MNDGMKILEDLVGRIRPLEQAAMEDFKTIWSPFTAGRKELVTRQGEVERYIYVVLDGVQRVYYSDDEGREATILFTYMPSFGGVLDSFLLQGKSRYAYETLTPSQFLRTSYSQFTELRNRHHSIEALVSHGLAGVVAGLEERLVEIQCFQAEDKFRSLLRRSPHILQLVPHKYLASYLGMDPTNFSKLMNKVRI